MNGKQKKLNREGRGDEVKISWVVNKSWKEGGGVEGGSARL